MRKFSLVVLFLMLTAVLAGCSLSLESMGLGKVAELLYDGAIVAQVTEKDGQILKVDVLTKDGHYDEGDCLYVDYSKLPENSALKEDAIITFSYDYLENVTVKSGHPYILADTIEITTYTPPAETTAPETMPAETETEDAVSSETEE